MTKWFSWLADRVSHIAGSPPAFVFGIVFVVVLAFLGQLEVNTGTTIVTFLMVFLLQHTQNRDTKALHAKLDSLLDATPADSKLKGIETRTAEEIEAARGDSSQTEP